MFNIVVFFGLLDLIFDTPNPTEDNPSDPDKDETDTTYVLFLQEDTRNCTATLIEPQYILTAAHCLEENGSQTKVTYGCTDLKDPQCKKIAVLNRSIHPGYKFPENVSLNVESNDIAVAKLAEPITSVKPVQLPDDKNWIPEGYATVIEYGFTEWEQRSETQKTFSLPIVRVYGASDEKMFVQRRIGMDQGDSGGPLIYNNVLYGVASILEEGLSDSYSVYINVNFYREFIETSIEDLKNRP